MFFVSLGFLLSFMACHEEENNPVASIRQAEGFFIVNEGTFNFGNASVSYYHYETGEVTHDLFKNANGHTAGDVLQQMFVVDDKGYLVLNNSGYVEVVNMETFESEGLIQPFESPRHFLPVSEGKAYVSDLYSNSIQVVNLMEGTVTGSIMMPFWTEQMEKVDAYVFVTSPWDIRLDPHDQIYVIDAENDFLADSIQVGYDPVAIARDGNNKLWIYCRGAESLAEPAGLYCVNPQTFEVERSLLFEDYDLGFAARLSFNSAGDTLYYLKNDIYAFALSDTNLPASPLIQASGSNFYALAVDPATGNLIVGDAIDYAQKGKVYIYGRQGNLLETTEAGVIPAQFLFY
ncbi:MAG: hypothetical protein KDC85_18090 [Saprospiraceae bacterium]|nr:hypothetical protein [Saprospiraceae bacterium]MCB9326484.1 hypothetical protein [Lewinellaceae bacterium]